jgi:hypothetical protein
LGDAEPGQTHALTCAQVQRQHNGFTLVGHQLAVGQRAGGDHAYHLAFYRTFAAHFAYLLANGHGLAQANQACQIVFNSVIGYACHHHGFAGGVATPGEGDVQQAGCLLRVGEKQLVEIPHAIKNQRVRMRFLDRKVLGDHGRMGGWCGVFVWHSLIPMHGLWRLSCVSSIGFLRPGRRDADACHRLRTDV